MSFHRTGGQLACCAMLSLLVTTAWADEVPARPDASNAISRREPTRFIRVRYDEFDSPVALQTASAKYILPGGDGQNKLEVVLEGVIHVGDRSYYREFNRRFRHYDAVLYELIAPPEKLVPDPAEERPHPLRTLQRVSADGLGFSSQLDEIDYNAANMVHSDLSPTELAAITQGRGDDQVTMLMEMLTDILRKRNINGDNAPEADDASPDGDAAEDRGARDLETPAGETKKDEAKKDEANDEEAEGELQDEPASDAAETPTSNAPNENEPLLTRSLRILADPDGAVKIRRLLAKGFDSSPSLEAMLRPSQQATLIRARNERALEVFQEQLDSGKRRIALFWGAGHMADFERQLVLNYGLQPAGVVWRDAWDLRDGAVEFSPLEAILEKSLRGSLKDAIQGLLRADPETDQP